MSNTGWIAIAVVFMVVFFAANNINSTVTGDSPISVASRTVSLDISSDGFLVDRADGLGFRNCVNDAEIPVWVGASSDWECAVQGASQNGTFTFQVDDSNVVATTTAVDMLGDDFTVTESPTGEANVSLNVLRQWADSTELTISGDAITVTQTFHTVDTESNDPTDNVADINGGNEGVWIVLAAEHGSRDVVIQDNAGTGTSNVQLAGNADFTMDGTRDNIVLFHNGTVWVEWARSQNDGPSEDVTHTHTTTQIEDGTILEADLNAIDAASDGECLTYNLGGTNFEWDTCGAGGSGDSISVNGSAATDANFLDGDIDWTLNTAASPDEITATVACTGCVDATDILDNTILEADLKAVDAAGDEECLTYELTGGDFEWQTCGAGSANSFETHNVDNGTDPVASSATDTLNWTSGTGITITGDSGTDTITVAATLGTSISSGEIDANTIINDDIATDAINTTELDDGADTPVAGECVVVATATSDVEYVDCNAGIVDADVPDTITIDLAATATALAADPSDCAADTKADSINASGDLTCSAVDTGDITDNTILEADLKAVDAAGDEECLTFETTGGDFEWQSCGGAATIDVEEDNASVEASATNLDFGSGFDVTSSPAGEANVDFDITEVTLADDSAWVGSSTSSPTAIALPDCDASTDHDLQYDQSTNAFSCDSTADDDVPESGDFGNANELDASGNLSCTGCVGTTEAAGLDISDDTNLTAGRSLTLTGDDVAADVELYTDTKGIWFEDPVATDDFASIWTANGFAVTITKIWCESDGTVNLDLQIDDGTPADVNGTDLVCDSTPAEDEAMGGDATMADGDRLDLVITSVSGSPTWVSIFWTFTYDD